jgi:hypothetical protein
MPLTGLSL